MNKMWREIPELFLSYAWKMSIGVFILFGIVHSAVLAVFDRSYGMIEGIGIGVCSAFAVFYFLELKLRLKERDVNRKVKELIREANSCFELSNQFEKEGKYEAQRQFKEDYDTKRSQILRLLSGDLKPEDIR